MNILRSIQNKDSIILLYKYDFKKKHSSQSKLSINYKTENQFLILEGIFAHRLDLNYQDTINIVCEEKKEVCFKRRLNRDIFSRGRKSGEVIKRFNKSWDLFHQNIHNYLVRNKVIVLNPLDKTSFNKLVINLHKLKNNN